MVTRWKTNLSLIIGGGLMAAALIVLVYARSAKAERAEAAVSGNRYTVVETQGFNLLVTDNANNKLYYYATDKDSPVGSPMKLRASLDLSQVGKDEIKITAHNLENIRKRDDK